MNLLVSNRALGAVAAAVVLTACAPYQNEGTRPRLLAADQARVSTVDPVVLMSELVGPARIDSDADLHPVACSMATQFGRLLWRRGVECVVLQPDVLRID